MTGTQAFFLPAADGQRYCLFHPPQGTPRSLVLHVHPFAEELNKSRRMAALQSRALAAVGHAVLQIDLLGCGDSSGDFGDAHWEAWIDDLLRAQHWLAQHAATPGLPLWLWGVRAGCLLAADAARSMPSPCHLLFWQASFADGGQQLQQFLRLRLAADMLASTQPGSTRSAMEGLRQQLAAGKALEIAGYTLAPALATGLQASRLSPLPCRPPARRQLLWLEVATSDTPALSPLAHRTLDAWRGAGWTVHGQALGGPPFWQSAEMEEAPALIDATLVGLDPEPAR
jgi:exosortase A-associated hydrolase 2